MSKRSLPQLASHCFNGSTFKRFCVLARLIGGDRTARATLRIRRMHPKSENPLAFTTKTDEEWQRIPWRPFDASQMANTTKRVVQTQPNLKKNPMNVAKKKDPRNPFQIGKEKPGIFESLSTSISASSERRKPPTTKDDGSNRELKDKQMKRSPVNSSCNSVPRWSLVDYEAKRRWRAFPPRNWMAVNHWQKTN